MQFGEDLPFLGSKATLCAHLLKFLLTKQTLQPRLQRIFLRSETIELLCSSSLENKICMNTLASQQVAKASWTAMASAISAED